ncbi:MAG: hypothetical protein DHS20C16_13370 [Phycisphaerae bacterium]|nr:MAG: hypothetical protein DHS20C16_13370 [Phycisphaerae bacterium]
MELLIIIAAILAGAGILIGVRLLEGAIDRNRIKRYVEDRGGETLQIKWRLFGPGWLGNKNQRMYRVVYRDADGRDHRTNCKTSMFSDVYFTGDIILKYQFTEVPKNKCLSCDYNLTGNVSGVCPECGAPLHEDQLEGNST